MGGLSARQASILGPSPEGQAKIARYLYTASSESASALTSTLPGSQARAPRVDDDVAHEMEGQVGARMGRHVTDTHMFCIHANQECDAQRITPLLLVESHRIPAASCHQPRGGWKRALVRSNGMLASTTGRNSQTSGPFQLSFPHFLPCASAATDRPGDLLSAAGRRRAGAEGRGFFLLSFFPSKRESDVS